MSGNPRGSIELRDDQQALLLQRLRAARGTPVDFDELRAVGIEHPAVVSYELEVAGLPIVQTRKSNRPALALAQRAEPLDSRDELESGDLPAVSSASRAWRLAWLSSLSGARLRVARLPAGHLAAARPLEASLSAARVLAAGLSARSAAFRACAGSGLGGARAATARLNRRAGEFVTPRAARGAMLAAALVVTIAGVAAVTTALIDHGGRQRGPLRAAVARSHSRRTSGGMVASAPRSSAVREGAVPALPQVPGAAATQSAAAPVSPTTATALDADGHQLLAEGRYAAAVGDLLGAIRAGGQSLARCTQPTTEECLTFAYALYDLGRALRLEGDPSAAIPILSERMRIDNQLPVVEHELDLARGASA